ncbi:MAG: c-type cytochrome [Acidobacteriota bacterium]
MKHWVFVLIGVSLLASLATGLTAEEKPASDQAELAARGKVLYRVYCRNCHGDAAKGGGPVAEYLTVEPTDLTVLAATNEGVYPTADVREVIDGREVRAHGYDDMPVWGDAFANTEDADEVEVRERIEALVAYLASIQEI